MCPMCSDPVTFGGGITMENTGPGFPGSALNSSFFTQYSAQRGSICFGSYVLAISRGIPMRSPSLPTHHHKARPNPHKVILEYKVSQQPPSIQPPRSGHLQLAPLAFVAAAFRGGRFFLCTCRPSYRPPPRNQKDHPQ